MDGPVPPRPVTHSTLPLRFDDRGPLVATAQGRLTWLGYPLSEKSQDKDLFGITMRRAVEALPRRCTEVSKAICIDTSTWPFGQVPVGTRVCVYWS